MGCFGSPVCNQVQHPYRQHGVFTVFNEFTKMQQGAIYHFGKGSHQGHDTGNNGTFEFKTTFIPEKGGQKSNNPMMLGRVRQAKFLETLDNGNFVFVGNLMEKGGNLLQQAVDGIFASRLEEGGNGEGGHEAIGIRRQNFQFGIAFTHHPGLVRGQCGQCPHGGKFNRGFGRNQIELQDGNGLYQILWFNFGQATNSPGRLVDHHDTLVS
mmetsp:Transcript_14065/g.25413  ORF Transcript_14065/g.25413 Transcript_14065/m.25413 type:complete len:210 (-) Transcript_14065:443-1072(-)